MTELNTRVNLTMQAIENQAPSQAHDGLNISKSKAFKRNQDVKELKILIFDVDLFRRT